MKVDKLNGVLGFQEKFKEIGPKIGSEAYKIAQKKDLREPQVAEYLLQIGDKETKNAYIKKYVKILFHNVTQNQDNKNQKQSLRLWQKFLPTYKEHKSELSEKTQSTIERISAKFPSKIEKVKIEKADIEEKGKEKVTETEKSVTTTTTSSPTPTQRPEGFQFDKFPEHTYKLESLSQVANVLMESTDEKVEKKEKPIKGDVLIQEIKSRVKEDPEIQQFTREVAKQFPEITSQYNPPFDHNRTGREVEGLFVNASDITFPEQSFIVAGLVRSNEEAARYLDTLLSKDVRVLASFHESTESTTRCNNFWHNEQLQKMTHRDGWMIRNVRSEVIAKEGTEENSPCIVESKLVAAREGKDGIELRTLTHFHYDRWRDRHPIPSTDLMITLLDRMEELSQNPETPIALNCKGGVGRSGSTAVAYLLKKRLQNESKEKPLDEIEVNLPQTVYEFRKQRSGVCGQGSQFAGIHETLFKLYERQKQERSQEIVSTINS